MPGTGSTDNSSTGRHGSATINSDLFDSAKYLSEPPSHARRLNDYTTVPRRTRPSSRHRQDFSGFIHERTTTSVEERQDIASCKSQCMTSVVEQKKDKSWSFKKLKNALKRSKSLKHENDNDSRSSSSDSKISEVLLSSVDSPVKSDRISGKDSKHENQRYVNDDDTYAAIDHLPSGYSLKDLTSCVRCHSGQSESDTNMAVTLPANTHTRGYGYSSQKGCVLKEMSSLTVRTANPRKKSSRKQKPEPEYGRSDFNRDNSRASFKEEASGKRQSNVDCKRSKSFSNVTSDKVAKKLPPPGPNTGDHMTGISSKQTEYETKDGELLYSLAKADDEPPPLPERTYIKLRNAASKENAHPDQSRHKGPIGIITEKGTTLALHEQTNNYRVTSYSMTTHKHVKKPSDGPHQSTFEHSTARPFMLHSPLHQDQQTVSSGYSSGSDYSHMPAPSLPRPAYTRPDTSQSLSSRKAQPLLPGCYNNRHEEAYDAPERRVKLRRPSPCEPDADDTADEFIASNVIHNLPLPPGPGGAQLIRTLHLDRILKSKWISGIAVTKKNEYIVVDQREAYLLDEEGTLKKIIGAKGSNKLIEPFNVCVSPANGNLVICDHAEQDIKIYTWKGQFLRRAKDPALTNIAGVAVTESKDIVIAGTDKQRVSVLTDDGKLAYTIPSIKDGQTKYKNRTPFEHPYSLAVNPLTGDIIIGDDYKQKVTAVSPGRHGEETRVLWRYCPGPGNRHFFPSSICADSQGYIFIADLYNEKVSMLDSSGKFVKTLLSRGDGLKGGPGAIAADGRGHLLVADEEKVIKVFKYKDDNGFAVTNRYSYCPQAT